MPNILLTRHCNLECTYCFAGNSKNFQKREELELEMYVYYLKHLRVNKINEVRLLGGEPLLHSKIRNILDISYRGGFQVFIFSNLAFHINHVKKIFSGFASDFLRKTTVNINLNPKDFYKNRQLENIKENINYLASEGINTIISTMLDENLDPDYVFGLCSELNVKEIKLKPLNGKEFSEITSSREYGKFVYELLKNYSKDFNIYISCGLSKFIFTPEELDEIKNEFKVNLRFGCFAQGGKYDIDIKGDISRCFPLNKLYSGINLKDYYNYEFKDMVKLLDSVYDTSNNEANCLGRFM